MGQYILAEDYVRAQHGKKVLCDEVDTALVNCDALVLPTLPIPAPQFGRDEVSLGDKVDLVRSAMLRLTQLFNLTGHPVLSIPCGQSRDSLPVGLQLVGVRNRTDDLLQLAAALESHIAGNRQTDVAQSRIV
jgi:aspartyl-tRNA(Asn)/glutamyl-tRNA(Gln) amidotransferase subunit A